jgi:hypothetical protein
MRTTRRITIQAAIAAAFIFLSAGCVTPPTINTSGFARPKSVALVDIPPLKERPRIGVLVPFLGFHFGPAGDSFFDAVRAAPGDDFVTKSSASSAPVGLIPALISASAAETEQKSEGFHDEVLRRFPGFDLRKDFMTALQSSLEASGLSVNLLTDGRKSPPYLRWPAAAATGQVYRSDSIDSSPPVDADVLVQVSPIAFYNAPGPLNLYRRNVSVGVALYNGRTKQFIGGQVFKFSTSDNNFHYMKYDTLVEDLPNAAPALRQALLSLVPKITDVVNGRPVQ